MNGLTQLSDSEWKIEAPTGNGRSQAVFLSHSEALGHGFLNISTTISIVTRSHETAAFLGTIAGVSTTPLADLFPVLEDIGRLAIGGLGFEPMDDQKGALTLRTSVPLSILDLSDPDALPTYVAHIAAMGDHVEQKIGRAWGSTDAKDTF